MGYASPSAPSGMGPSGGRGSKEDALLPPACDPPGREPKPGRAQSKTGYGGAAYTGEGEAGVVSRWKGGGGGWTQLGGPRDIPGKPPRNGSL